VLTFALVQHSAVHVLGTGEHTGSSSSLLRNWREVEKCEASVHRLISFLLSGLGGDNSIKQLCVSTVLMRETRTAQPT
jgi:hypothetical protein